jgi:hypothetical protein
MAITTPHESRVPIQNANGGRAASYRSESAFVTPGQAAMPAALNKLASGLDKVNKAVFEVGLEKQRVRNNTALLADQVALNDAYRAFDSDYRENHKGESALDAAADYEDFFEKQRAGLQRKWGGNPHLMGAVDTMFQQVRQGGLNRATAYADQEEAAWRQGEINARWTQVLTDAADSSLSLQDREASFQDWENSARMTAGQRFDGKTGQWGGGRNIDADLMKARRDWNLEIVEGMIAGGRLGDAKRYAAERSREFGDKADDVRMMIDARIEAAARKAEADRERVEKAAAEAWRGETVQAILADVKEYPTLEERRDEAYRQLEFIPDGEKRREVETLLRREFDYEERRAEAGTNRQVREYQELARNKGWTPAQAAINLGRMEELSDEARAALEKDYNGQREKVTPENMAALAKLRTMIDLGPERGGIAPSDQDAIDAFAWKHGFTSRQTENAHTYAEQGGNAGKLTQTMLNEAWRRLHPDQTGNITASTAPLWDAVASELDPGKTPTVEQVRKIMARLELEGETRGDFWAYAGIGKDETYGEAKAAERGGNWIPGGDDYHRIKAELERQGVVVTDERIREAYFKERGVL